MQTDEEDMGMSYDELNAYGMLRKVRKDPLSALSQIRWACCCCCAGSL